MKRRIDGKKGTTTRLVQKVNEDGQCCNEQLGIPSRSRSTTDAMRERTEQR